MRKTAREHSREARQAERLDCYQHILQLAEQGLSSYEDLLCHLENLAGALRNPAQAVFNLHVPPIRTGIDGAPHVNDDLTPFIEGGSVVMGSGGSEAVRTVIEKYQLLIALHGHIHESRGIVKLGKTVCINPGSAYGEGVLHGALFELNKKKGLKRYQLTSG